MATYKLSDSVALFTSQTTIVNNLWTVYVVATFAAAGFGLTSTTLSNTARAAVTLGFFAFTLGHLNLVMDALRILKGLGDAIVETIDSDGAEIPEQFKSVLRDLAGTVRRRWPSIAVHLFIDICVIIALWCRTAGSVFSWIC